MGGRGRYPAGHRVRNTDDFSDNVLENPVHMRDKNAMILQYRGMDHYRPTFNAKANTRVSSSGCAA
jgi:hypothetical protein